MLEENRTTSPRPFANAPAPKGRIAEHPWGLCMYNKQLKICYIPIPKNCTTAFVRLVYNNDHAGVWQESNYYTLEYPVNKYIVILRDPVERFISAVNMFFRQNRVARPHQITTDTFYTLDCHYVQQYKFIKDLDHCNIEFYYHSECVLNDINSRHNIFDSISRVNFTPDEHKLVTSVDQEQIKSIYKKDYELIESVQFKNTMI